MTRFVYPRLPLASATARMDEISEALRRGGLRSIEVLAGVEHPHAAPVATGGRVVQPDHIADVRAAVMDALASWTTRGEVPRNQAAAFDLVLGRTLHEHLQIIPADAAHEGTWNFLTLVVLPDIAALRFPDMHRDRLTGTPRNVLRRTWIRQEILGDLLHSTDRPLGEDELVGLFERTALARNRALVRRLAVTVLEYSGSSARSEWARALYKRVTFSTGPRLLDALTDEELITLIHGAEKAAEHRDSLATTSDVVQPEAQAIDPDSSRKEDPQTGTSTVDLESEFQQAMIQIYQRAKSELGYNASYLLRMLANEGAVVTARRLVMSEHASDGFLYLWEQQRLDLTVEALVVDISFAPLFQNIVVERAERRLEEYGETQ